MSYNLTKGKNEKPIKILENSIKKPKSKKAFFIISIFKMSSLETGLMKIKSWTLGSIL